MRINLLLLLSIVFFAHSCGKQSAPKQGDKIPVDGPVKSTQTQNVHDELEVAKAKTKKAEEDLLRAREGLKKASAEERAKIEKALLDTQKFLEAAEKELKEKAVEIIEATLKILKTKNEKERKAAYLSQTNRKSGLDIVRAFFEQGKEPARDDLLKLSQNELQHIQSDLDAIMLTLLDT